MSTLTHRPARGTLLRPFAAKPVPGVSTITHLGWDIGWGGGYAVYAAAAGKVVEVRWSSNTRTNNRTGGYGNYFIIDHGHGITTLYAHQPNTPMLVRLGEQVSGGERVGTMGNTGNAAGAHLHFEVRLNGVPDDPARYYASASGAGTDGTPVDNTPAPPKRRKKTMSTGWFTDRQNRTPPTATDWALAGDGTGEAAWLPLSGPTAQDVAEQHGPFAYLAPSSFDSFKARYLSPPKVGEVTVAPDPATVAAIIAAVDALPVGIAAENARRVAN